MQTFLSKRHLKRDLAKDIVEVFYEKVNSEQSTERVFDSLSSSLQVRCVAGTETSHRLVLALMYQAICNCVSHVQVEVAMHISLPLVKSNNVFGGCSSGFTASLSVLMREMAFTGDETIFHTNDVSSELYLIAKNTVKIMVTKDGQQSVRCTCCQMPAHFCWVTVSLQSDVSVLAGARDAWQGGAPRGGIVLLPPAPHQHCSGGRGLHHAICAVI